MATIVKAIDSATLFETSMRSHVDENGRLWEYRIQLGDLIEYKDSNKGNWERCEIDDNHTAHVQKMRDGKPFGATSNPKTFKTQNEATNYAYSTAKKRIKTAQKKAAA